MSSPPPGSELHALMTQFPRTGTVRWIGLRPARDVPMREVEEAVASLRPQMLQHNQVFQL